MITQGTGWRKGIASIAAALAVSFPVAFDAEAGHGGVVKLKGGLTTVQVECETLCTEGPLTGGLAGTLEFEMESMSETSNPDVVTYVGVNTITTSQGTLTGTDYGIWNLSTGEFIDVTYFTSGTGRYQGVRGTLTIIGGFDPVTGTGSSHYVALLHLR